MHALSSVVPSRTHSTTLNEKVKLTSTYSRVCSSTAKSRDFIGNLGSKKILDSILPSIKSKRFKNDINCIRNQSLLENASLRRCYAINKSDKPHTKISSLVKASIIDIKLARLLLHEHNSSRWVHGYCLGSPRRNDKCIIRDTRMNHCEVKHTRKESSSSSIFLDGLHRNDTQVKLVYRKHYLKTETQSLQKNIFASDTFPSPLGKGKKNLRKGLMPFRNKIEDSNRIFAHNNSPRQQLFGYLEFSDFDLRSCHSNRLVSKEHGFLSHQNIEELVVKTGYSRQEVYSLWIRFKALCSIAKSPTGIDKETFQRGIPLLAVEDEKFVNRVFQILDQDGSGIIDWDEFVLAMSAIQRGDTKSRLTFLFRVYDLNGDGKISRKELADFFLSSLMVCPTEDINEVSDTFVEKIFATLSPNKYSDSISMEEALDYIQKNDIDDIYELFGRSMITTSTL